MIIVTRSFIFKGTNYAGLLEILTTPNKKRVPLLHLLINCIPPQSATQIFPLITDYTLYTIVNVPKNRLRLS